METGYITATFHGKKAGRKIRPLPAADATALTKPIADGAKLLFQNRKAPLGRAPPQSGSYGKGTESNRHFIIIKAHMRRTRESIYGNLLEDKAEEFKLL